MATIRDLRKTGYNGEKYWEVNFTNEMGRRRRLRFANQKEAQRFLRHKDAQVLSLQEGLPDGYANGDRRGPTVGEIYKEYKAAKIDIKSKESAKRSAIKGLAPSVKRFGDLRAKNLSLVHIDAWRGEWLGAGKKVTGFRENVGGLKTMLSWAVRRHHIPFNPLKDLEPENARNEEKIALTPKQIDLFIEKLASDPEVREYFVLGIDTGMRIGELWGLRWDHVDLKGQELNLPAELTKTSKARTVPLPHACLSLLKRLSVCRDRGPYVLWHPTDPWQVTKRVKKLSKRHLPWTHTPHHWRVTFATLMLKGREIIDQAGEKYLIGADVGVVAEIGGWEKDSSILRRIYQKVTKDQKRAAMQFVNFGVPDVQSMYNQSPEALERQAK